MCDRSEVGLGPGSNSRKSKPEVVFGTTILSVAIFARDIFVPGSTSQHPRRTCTAMSTWETDWAAGWTAAVWATEDWSAGCSAGSEQTTWGGSCGSWEQSGQQSRSPDRSPYSREPGNGNRPKANDPKGWSRGENRPTEFEYNAMLKFGKAGVTKR